MRIVVNYPQKTAQIVLRTEADWNLDIAPVEVGETHATFEVEVTTTLPLKPCLREGDTLHWAHGLNYIVTAHEGTRQLWPYFFDKPHGRVTDLQHVEFEGVTRSIRVYLPPGYAENTLRKFPVLYMQDGNNLFFPEEAFGGREWKVDETLDRLDSMNALRKVIVVGIAPGDRQRDYTKPGYDQYARFLVEKVKPMIDSTLRSLPEPQNSIVMGSSLGGVAALHVAWSHPKVFARVACMSSTFGVFDDLFERIEKEPKRDLLVYLDSGWPKDNYERTNAMRDLLMSKGFTLGKELLQFSFPEDGHNETSWSHRLHLPFQFFFGHAWRRSRGEH